MPVARIHHLPEGWSQHKQRSLVFFYDQHRSSVRMPHWESAVSHEMGRPYFAWVERPADGAAMPMPVGPLTPAGWQAPWHAPDAYLVKSIGRVAQDGSWVQGQTRTQFFRIDYGTMMHDDTESMKAYYERAVREAAAQKYDLKLIKYGQPIPFELEIIVGKAPRSPRLAEACSAGNDWILGQRLPEYNPKTGRVEVIPDAALARLIRMHTTDLMTPDEAIEVSVAEEQKLEAADKAMTEVRDVMDLNAALRKDMEEMKAQLAALTARKAEAAERMANARASKKTGTKKAPSETTTVG